MPRMHDFVKAIAMAPLALLLGTALQATLVIAPIGNVQPAALAADRMIGINECRAARRHHARRAR